MNRDLVVGDQVILSPNTRWHIGRNNPMDTIGTVSDINAPSNLNVIWSNGSRNGYRLSDSDLIRVHNYKFATRTEAREAAKDRGFVVEDLGEGEELRWFIVVKEV